MKWVTDEPRHGPAYSIEACSMRTVLTLSMVSDERVDTTIKSPQRWQGGELKTHQRFSTSDELVTFVRLLTPTFPLLGGRGRKERQGRREKNRRKKSESIYFYLTASNVRIVPAKGLYNVEKGGGSKGEGRETRIKVTGRAFGWSETAQASDGYTRDKTNKIVDLRNPLSLWQKNCSGVNVGGRPRQRRIRKGARLDDIIYGTEGKQYSNLSPHFHRDQNKFMTSNHTRQSGTRKSKERSATEVGPDGGRMTV
ncbi:hypothetical protein Naga_100237g6 [Nannochloropsis gaditana]|uniref:Uncharacterized protein n=1 Tax=Nannochloropsis gaditana TaxID=72520 RepID=W7TV53_9STRA|nr:hypothetical protein Naga_100237g6 [Nannochloropsis gaditana]